jgi:hypothetical protein
MFDGLDVTGTILHEPMVCCGGVRSVMTLDELVGGMLTSLVIVQHELWCCLAAVDDT